MSAPSYQHFALARRLDGGLTGDKTLEKWFVGQVLVMFLEMLFGWGYELDSSKLVAVIESGNNMLSMTQRASVPALFESRNDITDKTTLQAFR
jgi:hypothetical protein